LASIEIVFVYILPLCLGVVVEDYFVLNKSDIALFCITALQFTQTNSFWLQDKLLDMTGEKDGSVALEYSVLAV
jgi:hypothetical protein